VTTADHHDAHDETGGIHATFRGYMTGFVLSVILTAIPFWLVMGKVFSPTTITIVILALGMVQILVHMVYFLHMDSKIEQGWSMMALVFTLIMVVITLSGSLWVMYHLNTNTMPVTLEKARQLP
jgi:cytochrome o ubiquinol oxidase operon protein cyoD